MTAAVSVFDAMTLGGLKALLPLVRVCSNEQIMRFIPDVPLPEVRSLEKLGRVPGRDSIYYFLNMLRVAARRGDSAAIESFLKAYVLEPVIHSEKARAKLKRQGRGEGLSSIIITPTVICNLRCTHCYNLYEIHEDRNKHLPTETISRVLSEAQELGAYRVSFIGGEPLIRWRDIAKLSHEHPQQLFTIITNGLLLTDEAAHALAQTGRVELAVSIEGFEEQHDAIRGEGSYKGALAAMARYRDAGGLVMCSPTITTENYETILSDEFLDLMEEHGAYMAYLHHYDLVGGQESDELLPSSGQLAWMKTRIEQIHKTRAISILSNVLSDLVRGGCPAARDFVHVNHKGEVEPCCMVPFAADSVHERALEDILNSPFMNRVRDAPYDEHGIKRCLVGENSAVLREAIGHKEAKGTTLRSYEVLSHAEAEFGDRLPTCFCTKA